MSCTKPILTRLFSLFIMGSMAAFGATPLSHAAEDKPTLNFGSPDRLDAKTLLISNKIITLFCAHHKITCTFKVMPNRRIQKAFNQGQIDILLYQDYEIGPNKIRTATPFAAATLYAIHKKGSFKKDTLDLSNPATVLCWRRGDGLGSTLQYKGAFVETDSFDQQLRLIMSRNITACLDWNSEIFARISMAELEAKGLALLPIVEDIPLFPVMKTTSKKASYIRLLNEWYVSAHKKGILFPIFQREGYETVYPFGKNWQKWIKKSPTP